MIKPGTCLVVKSDRELIYLPMWNDPAALSHSYATRASFSYYLWKPNLLGIYVGGSIYDNNNCEIGLFIIADKAGHIHVCYQHIDYVAKLVKLV